MRWQPGLSEAGPRSRRPRTRPQSPGRLMAERRGLGRGLSALLDEATDAGAGGAPSGVREVPIEMIHRNPNQPRLDFAAADLETLAASIRDKGVLQPIL